MGVDHSVSSGFGYIVELPVETVEESYDGDGVQFLEAVLESFPDVTYIVGGSRYKADNIHFAIVVKASGFNKIQDMAGIYPVPSLLTVANVISVLAQLDDAYCAITGVPPEYEPAHLVAGLWH